MPKMTGAAAVSKAGAKVLRAEKRVQNAKKALAKAIKTKDQADYEYLELLKQTLPAHLQRAATQPTEVTNQPAA